MRPIRQPLRPDPRPGIIVPGARRQTVVQPVTRRVLPGGGMSRRVGRALPPEKWPGKVSRQRVAITRIMTCRPDDFLTIAELADMVTLSGIPVTTRNLHKLIFKLWERGWLERQALDSMPYRHGYRLTSGALAAAKYYIGDDGQSDDE